MKKPLLIFVLLQMLDVATTLVAFRLGGSENNPLVAHFLAMGALPGLLLSKATVIGLALLGVWWGKANRLYLANLVFALVVAWNLSIIGRLAAAA